MFRRRTIILACVFSLLFGGVAWRLWYLQLTRHEYYKDMANQRQHRLRQIPPARGKVLDRRGRVLAADTASFELWFRPASYSGQGSARRLRSNLGDVTIEQMQELVLASGKDRELKMSIALQYLSTSNPLVAQLAELIRTASELPAAARLRVARTLLESAVSRGDDAAPALKEPRRCFADVPIPVVQRIEQLQANPYAGEKMDALEVRGGYKRTYPYGDILGHVTGYVGNLTPEEYRILRGRWLEDGRLEDGAGEVRKNGRVFFSLEPNSDEAEILRPKLIKRSGEEFRVKGYLSNEMVGRGGVEAWYNDELRGRHVWRLEQMVRPDPSGPRQFIPSGPTRQAINGHDIALTLDAEFQKRITKIFDEELLRLSKLPEHRGALNRQQIDIFAGAAVVMNANNGEIYALVSLPNFDPNSLSADFHDLLKDKRKPLINRVIAGCYPPGSTIKPLVAVAALEEGRIRSNTHFTCEGVEVLGGKEFVCMNRVHHGSIEVTDALKSSCNVFFYHTGAALGGSRLAHWLSDLGLGRQTGIDLPGERDGHLPANALAGHHWSLGETYHLAIGQGAIDATPLQMAVAYATIVTGGNLPRPHLRYNPSDPELYESRSRVRLAPQTVKSVEEGMWKVVQSTGYPRGTASATARIPGFEYMAKTGSAQKNRRDTHAWLVAAAPYNEPEIIISVIVPFGNHGGSTCGVIVRKIVEAYFGLEDFKDKQAEEEQSPDATEYEDGVDEPNDDVRPGNSGDPEDIEAHAPEGTLG